jgi:hypothetical protein
MKNDNLLESIKNAIADGNHVEARTLLRVALKEPTAEIYHLASQVALNDQQRQSFLSKAKQMDFSTPPATQLHIKQQILPKSISTPLPEKRQKPAVKFQDTSIWKWIQGRFPKALLFGFWGFLFSSVGTAVIMLVSDNWAYFTLHHYVSMYIFISVAWAITSVIVTSANVKFSETAKAVTLFGLFGVFVFVMPKVGLFFSDSTFNNPNNISHIINEGYLFGLAIVPCAILTQSLFHVKFQTRNEFSVSRIGNAIKFGGIGLALYCLGIIVIFIFYYAPQMDTFHFQYIIRSMAFVTFLWIVVGLFTFIQSDSNIKTLVAGLGIGIYGLMIHVFYDRTFIFISVPATRSSVEAALIYIDICTYYYGLGLAFCAFSFLASPLLLTKRQVR